MKRNIISARAEGCQFCKGITYTLKFKNGMIIEQCKECGALKILKGGESNENKKTDRR